jgi:pimeloyl-ACP methyl ester carboxylesterase
LLRGQGDAWDAAELEAKATALSQASALAQRAVAESGAFSPDDLRRRWEPVLSSGVRLEVILGEPQHGGMVPADARAYLVDVLGEDRVHVIRGAGHSPQRSHRGEFLDVLDRILA